MDHLLPTLRPFSTAQARAMSETARLWGLYGQAEQAAAHYEGTMTWRPVRGVERLVRSGPSSLQDRRRVEIDLGARSRETEAEFARYVTGRAESLRHRDDSRDAVAIQAAANRAAGLGRLPTTAGIVLRALSSAGLMGSGLRLVEAGALWAYESGAGGHVAPGQDIDPVESLSRGFVLAGRGVDAERVRKLATGVELRHSRIRGRLLDTVGYAIDVREASDDPVLDGLVAGKSLVALGVDATGWPVPLAAPPVRAYVAERLKAGDLDGLDEGAALALAQGRAAVACIALPKA